MIEITASMTTLDPPPERITARRIHLSNQGLYPLGQNLFEVNACHWQPPLLNTVQLNKNRSNHAEKKV